MTQHSRDTPQFYLTAPSPCPYLPGRHERKVFTHLVGDKAGDLNDLLTHGGFRRSQSIAYRPACDQCRACVSVRVIANEFRPSRNFRKIAARNADIAGEQRSAVPTSEQYSVFRAYLDARHRHGGMADMTVLDYAMMVEDSHVETRIIEYRKRGIDTGITGRGQELVAVALTDVLSDGLSMVYSFFEPSEESRSLGTFMILDHIARARRQGLPYVYLGYWIEGSKKMDYKGRFLPQQRLAPSGWLRIDAAGEVFLGAAGLTSDVEHTVRPPLGGHHPRKRVTQYAAASRSITTVSGILGRLGHRKPGDDSGVLSPHPKNVSNSSFTFRITMMPATIHATVATGSEIANLPILRRSDTNRTSGMTANGSCIDRMTWLNTRSCPVPRSP